MASNDEGDDIALDGAGGVANRRRLWDDRAVRHVTSQALNPFSSQFTGADATITASTRPRVGDGEYGRPVAGSQTERRGIRAHGHVTAEVVELCDIIKSYGRQIDNRNLQGTGVLPCWVMRFGELFELYTRISNKLVGILLRARKHGLVRFEGEMLYQGRDDDVVITLVAAPDDLKLTF